eukprot:6340817-Amphidinium_carterae.2
MEISLRQVRWKCPFWKGQMEITKVRWKSPFRRAFESPEVPRTLQNRELGSPWPAEPPQSEVLQEVHLTTNKRPPSTSIITRPLSATYPQLNDPKEK